MVNYKLGFYKKDNSKEIDLESIFNIKTQSSIQTIDEFTTNFNNEDELKYYLLSKGLINNKEYNSKISIIYRYNGKIQKLPVIYKNQKGYITDEMLLKAKLNSLSNNIEFLEKLANHYSIGNSRFNPQGLNVSDIRLYLSDVRANGGYTFNSRLLETALNDLFLKAISTLNKSTGELKINYRGLRDLVVFVSRFESKENLKLEKEELSNLQQNDSFEEEQITFSDIIQEKTNGKWILSSEGDPDFPPNSEEEANYLRYLEKLQEIEDYDIEDNSHYTR